MRKANRFDSVGDVYFLVEVKQSDIVFEVTKSKIVGDHFDHKSGFWTFRRVATIMFSQRYANHEPHQPDNII